MCVYISEGVYVYSTQQESVLWCVYSQLAGISSVVCVWGVLEWQLLTFFGHWSELYYLSPRLVQCQLLVL